MYTRMHNYKRQFEITQPLKYFWKMLFLLLEKKFVNKLSSLIALYLVETCFCTKINVDKHKGYRYNKRMCKWKSRNNNKNNTNCYNDFSQSYFSYTYPIYCMLVWNHFSNLVFACKLLLPTGITSSCSTGPRPYLIDFLWLCVFSVLELYW
jgi:hypothetical protein